MLGGAGNVAAQPRRAGRPGRASSAWSATTARPTSSRRLLGERRAGRRGLRCATPPADDAEDPLRRRRPAAAARRSRDGSAAVDGDVEQRLVERDPLTRPTGADLLLLSDYGKGVVTDAVIAADRGGAPRAGKPVLVDSKGRDFGRYARRDMIKPNAAELAHAAGRREIADEAVVGRGAASCCERIGVDWLLVTRAPTGMSLAVRGERCRIPADARARCSTSSGAGDTVLAALAPGWRRRADAGRAAFARQSRRQRRRRQGAAPRPSRPDELRGALAAQRGRAEAKIARRRGRPRDWSRAGAPQGLQDRLHQRLLRHPAPGPRRLICPGARPVRPAGRRAQQRRLGAPPEGPARPVNDQQTRALVLAALAGVDAVVLFDEDTPIELIRALRPDVLIKGADYRRRGRRRRRGP